MNQYMMHNALRHWRTGRDTQSGFYARMLHNELIIRLCKGVVS